MKNQMNLFDNFNRVKENSVIGEKILKEKIQGALICSSIGDALGWPTEFGRYPVNVRKRFGKNFIKDYIEWEKIIGGKYWGYREKIKEGSYSDDTQLSLAVARCINDFGDFDADKFAYLELPLWLHYERGGGRTIKTAARSIINSKKEWLLNFFKNKDMDYRRAGANGAAMRVLPIAIVNVNNEKRLYSDSIKNTIITHGHPRAIIGTMIYASTVRYLLKETNLNRRNFYSWLLEEIKKLTIFEQENEWLQIWIREWDSKAKNGNFNEEFQKTKSEAKKYLENIERFLSKDDKDYYHFTRALTEYKGSGISTIFVTLYLFMKYLDNPEEGILKAVNMIGSDTDTIASFVGGLSGAYYGLSAVNKSLINRLQDKDYILRIGGKLFEIITGNRLTNHISSDRVNRKEAFLRILAWEIGLHEMFWDALKEDDQIIHPVLGKGKITRKEIKKIQREGYIVKLIEVIFDCGQTCIFHSRVSDKNRISESLSKEICKSV